MSLLAMINIDHYAYLSKLKQTDPLIKLSYAILALGVCLWANTAVVSVLTLVIMSWWTIRQGGTPLGIYIRLMLVPFSFLMISVITIAVNVSADPDIFLFSLKVFGSYIGVSQYGILTAANLFLKALGAVSCLYYLSLNTPMVDLLAVLRRLKVPKLMVELMGLIYRFIFVLLETVDTMITAQHSRLGYTTLSSGYRSLAALASTLFIRSYKSSDELYTALEARGYDGELTVLEEKVASHWQEFIPTMAIIVFLILVALFFKHDAGGLL